MVELKKYEVLCPDGQSYFILAKDDDDAFEKIAEEWGDENGPDYAFAGEFDFRAV